MNRRGQITTMVLTVLLTLIFGSYLAIAATGSGQPFADVSSAHWAFDYIEAIKEAGITTGYGDGTYHPETPVTREQMAAFIIRAMHGETFSYTPTPYFTDVPASHWAFKYVQKLKELGITTGCGSGQYCPEEIVTREQMAAFLIRARVGEDFSYDQNPYFTDVPSDHWAFDYIQKLKELGVTTGCGSGQYCPQAEVTRDQMAAFLGRAFLGMQTETPANVTGLRIARATCVASTWGGEQGLVLAAEVLDASGQVGPNASVWVIAPDGTRMDLPYEPWLNIHAQGKHPMPIVLGEYTFNADSGGASAMPVAKTLSRSELLGSLTVVTGCPDADPGDSFTIGWNPVAGAQGYFVNLVNEDTSQSVWSNVAGGFFDSLPSDTQVTIPSGLTEPNTPYALYIIASNAFQISDASAASGVDMELTPGNPFNMETACCTVNSPQGRFLGLNLWLEDCFGEDIEGAQVWAVYPTGRTAPYIHNINGWYEVEPGDWPDLNDPRSFGTYTFYAFYDGKQMSKTRTPVNYFLPVPEKVVITPASPVRGQPFTVTWDSVPGATAYCIDLYEEPSRKMLYHECLSTPSHTVPAEIWDHLTSGNEYEICTHCMDVELYRESSANSLKNVRFTAP
jgi:hypothetical protein